MRLTPGLARRFLLFALILTGGFSACGRTDVRLRNIPGGEEGAPPSALPPDGTLSCVHDCDCVEGMRCQATGGELGAGFCVAGAGQCAQRCDTACAAAERCVDGACVARRCPDELACGDSELCEDGACRAKRCPDELTCGEDERCSAAGRCEPKPPSVAGEWKTSYQMDISEFAKQSSQLVSIVNMLNVALSAQSDCSDLSTTEGKLGCAVHILFGEQINLPPWMPTLVSMLTDLFRVGGKPVVALGTLTVVETSETELTADETFSSLWMEYDGQLIDVTQSPSVGSLGNLKMKAKPFTGTRDDAAVHFGPRDIEFDVNKLVVGLLNLAIQTATEGKATNLSGLLKIALCDRLPPDTPLRPLTLIACKTAADAFGRAVEIVSVGLGGIHLTRQDAPIVESTGDRVADALGDEGSPGALEGTFSNGVFSGPLGAAPNSAWHAARP